MFDPGELGTLHPTQQHQKQLQALAATLSTSTSSHSVPSSPALGHTAPTPALVAPPILANDDEGLLVMEAEHGSSGGVKRSAEVDRPAAVSYSALGLAESSTVEVDQPGLNQGAVKKKRRIEPTLVYVFFFLSSSAFKQQVLMLVRLFFGVVVRWIKICEHSWICLSFFPVFSLDVFYQAVYALYNPILLELITIYKHTTTRSGTRQEEKKKKEKKRGKTLKDDILVVIPIQHARPTRDLSRLRRTLCPTERLLFLFRSHLRREQIGRRLLLLLLSLDFLEPEEIFSVHLVQLTAFIHTSFRTSR